MKEALKEAEKAAARGEIPVGAVIIDGLTNKIIASSGNLVESALNPLAHAEMNVIAEACRITKSKFLSDCDMYVTLEPCAMCAQAISLARIRRLYFGAYDIKSGGVDHGARVFQSKSCHHVPEIYGGIYEDECSGLLTDFFAGLRSE